MKGLISASFALRLVDTSLYNLSRICGNAVPHHDFFLMLMRSDPRADGSSSSDKMRYLT